MYLGGNCRWVPLSIINVFKVTYGDHSGESVFGFLVSDKHKLLC